MSAFPSDIEGKKIVLGLSGGVDSAVAAILLKQHGADVHALHMTNWEDDDGYCTAAQDLQDARQVCEQLEIPLHHVNFAREYRDRVFQYFLDEYQAGRTPNPDVLCNREIKFGVFRTYAKRLGGEFLATGHYARTRIVDGEAQLLKAADESKDQSYFLHAVTAEALAETVFPLGDLQKSEVRAIARDNALPVFDKKASARSGNSCRLTCRRIPDRCRHRKARASANTVGSCTTRSASARDSVSVDVAIPETNPGTSQARTSRTMS
jgi:tRNA-specific 2-thiouridylase